MAKRLEGLERKERHRIHIQYGIPIPERGIQRDARPHRKDAQDHIKLDADSKASKPETITNNHPSEGHAVHAKQKATLRDEQRKHGGNRVRNAKPLTNGLRLENMPKLRTTSWKAETDTKQNGHSKIFETHEKRLHKGMGKIYHDLCGRPKHIQETKPNCQQNQDRRPRHLQREESGDEPTKCLPDLQGGKSDTWKERRRADTLPEGIDD